MSVIKSYEEIIDSSPRAQPRRLSLRSALPKAHSASPEEQSEPEDYLQLEHIMIMAKARARQHTRPAH